MADDNGQTGRDDKAQPDRERDENGSGQTGGTPDSGAGYGNNADDQGGGNPGQSGTGGASDGGR